MISRLMYGCNDAPIYIHRHAYGGETVVISVVGAVLCVTHSPRSANLYCNGLLDRKSFPLFHIVVKL